MIVEKIIEPGKIINAEELKAERQNEILDEVKAKQQKRKLKTMQRKDKKRIVNTRNVIYKAFENGDIESLFNLISSYDCGNRKTLEEYFFDARNQTFNYEDGLTYEGMNFLHYTIIMASEFQRIENENYGEIANIIVQELYEKFVDEKNDSSLQLDDKVTVTDSADNTKKEYDVVELANELLGTVWNLADFVQRKEKKINSTRKLIRKAIESKDTTFLFDIIAGYGWADSEEKKNYFFDAKNQTYDELMLCEGMNFLHYAVIACYELRIEAKDRENYEDITKEIVKILYGTFGHLANDNITVMDTIHNTKREWNFVQLANEILGANWKMADFVSKIHKHNSVSGWSSSRLFKDDKSKRNSVPNYGTKSKFKIITIDRTLEEDIENPVDSNLYIDTDTDIDEKRVPSARNSSQIKDDSSISEHESSNEDDNRSYSVIIPNKAGLVGIKLLISIVSGGTVLILPLLKEQASIGQFMQRFTALEQSIISVVFSAGLGGVVAFCGGLIYTKGEKGEVNVALAGITGGFVFGSNLIISTGAQALGNFLPEHSLLIDISSALLAMVAAFVLLQFAVPAIANALAANE